MRRNCERPGCAEPATVAFGMIPEDLAVWLEAVDPATLGEVRPGLLCTRHADAMVVPKGWTLDDRREVMPRLFRMPQRQAPPRRPGDPTGRLRRPRAEDWATLDLFDTPDDDMPLDATPEPVVEDTFSGSDPAIAETADEAPWLPQFDQSDDLNGLLTARSPLLRRAFGMADDEVDGGRPS